mgnify:CR=1 FL=1
MKTVVADCPHCNPADFALEHLLTETNNFRVVADAHPLQEGHILIIPKEHISCAGEFLPELFDEFESLYKKFSLFLQKIYGSVSSFEHGKIGQTVFHAHVHLLPYRGDIYAIVPEENSLTPVDGISFMKNYFQKHGQYLFVSTENNSWMVDTKIGQPRFFRDRFAAALGEPARGNWKTMHEDEQRMKKAATESRTLIEKWKNYEAA